MTFLIDFFYNGLFYTELCYKKKFYTDYWQKNRRKLKLQHIYADLGIGPHMLGNGSLVLGNWPHVLVMGLNCAVNS